MAQWLHSRLMRFGTYTAIRADALVDGAGGRYSPFLPLDQQCASPREAPSD